MIFPFYSSNFHYYLDKHFNLKEVSDQKFEQINPENNNEEQLTKAINLLIPQVNVSENFTSFLVQE